MGSGLSSGGVLDASKGWSFRWREASATRRAATASAFLSSASSADGGGGDGGGITGGVGVMVALLTAVLAEILFFTGSLLPTTSSIRSEMKFATE